MSESGGLGAYLQAEFKSRPSSDETFAVRASVVIPVRNRERTIAEAVRSVARLRRSPLQQRR